MRDPGSTAVERVWLVAGLGFGDEGKGSVVDWLVRRHQADLVVRYNGGPQAAHHVVTRDGRRHCFAQLGAGSLCPGVRTFLSRFMLVDPLALGPEVDALRRCGVADAWQRLTIDPRCVVVTPFHWLLNQIEELARGEARHGSCGRGVGQAQLDSERPGQPVPVVRVGDLRDPDRLLATLRLLWLIKVDQAEQIADAHKEVPALAALVSDLRQPHRVPALAAAYHLWVAQVALSEVPPASRQAVFEGAQGVLLDRRHGFFPHVTPSSTTFAQAELLVDEWAPRADRVRVGVLRAYSTRHGAGPLPTEDRELTGRLPDQHNGGDPWQGQFRLGWFDAVLARHALRACEVIGSAQQDQERSRAPSIDALVVTCLDRLAGVAPLRLAVGYRDQHGDGDRIVAELPAIGSDATARQAQIAWLSRVRPVYRELPGFADAGAGGAAEGYLAALEEQLGVSVAAVSLGPTAQDKQVRAACGGLDLRG